VRAFRVSRLNHDEQAAGIRGRNDRDDRQILQRFLSGLAEKRVEDMRNLLAELKGLAIFHFVDRQTCTVGLTIASLVVAAVIIMGLSVDTTDGQLVREDAFVMSSAPA
jgi:hypothetical protein